MEVLGLIPVNQPWAPQQARRKQRLRAGVLILECLIYWERKLYPPGNSHIPQKWHFEDDFPFPKVGYVNSLEGRAIAIGSAVIVPQSDHTEYME